MDKNLIHFFDSLKLFNHDGETTTHIDKIINNVPMLVKSVQDSKMDNYFNNIMVDIHYQRLENNAKQESIADCEMSTALDNATNKIIFDVQYILVHA